jgi:guanosine-3',5'-bis(diphosphate) 3'-pyrophosphohydrolase
VAAILTEQRLDDATIVTALLHDTIEDTRAPIPRSRGFGKPSRRTGRRRHEADQPATVEPRDQAGRELPQAVHGDVQGLRVILVKLADRLHNMRTIRHMPPEKQAKKARETMDIYAPLAGRMGMQWMRDELEDLSFACSTPTRAPRSSAASSRCSGNRRRHSRDHRRHRATVLEKAASRPMCSAARRSPIRSGARCRRKGAGLLAAVGHLRLPRHHRDRGRLLPRSGRHPPALARGAGRFKDYISQPKSNGYRSIHTTVSGRDGKRVEVQIRTRQMHEVAEAGVAAHWSYRDGVRTENPFAVDPAKWLESLTKLRARRGSRRISRAREARDVFRPGVLLHAQGRCGEAAEGATPIDFAYAIHTRIGEFLRRRQGRRPRVPLWTRLKNGQSVEIITAEGQRPQATWLDIAVTGKAKAAIRRNLREVDRDRYHQAGRELARVAFEQIGKKATDKALATAAKLRGPVDLLARLGSAELSSRTLVETLYPELLDKPTRAAVPADRAVVGLDADQAPQRAACCQPVPGERIVGISTRGRGVLIHAIDCPSLVEVEDQPDRWVDLHWQPGRHEAVYAVTLIVTLLNDAGVLGRICTLIGEQNANISNMHFTDRKPDFYRMHVDVDIRDIEHLYSVMTAVEADSDVAGIERLKTGPDGS